MLDITNKTKGSIPKLPFLALKNSVLGKQYELSLVFIGSTRSRNLNKKYRKKDKPADVLSFPLESKSGEMFIDLKEAHKQAPNFEKSYKQFIGLLFVHGLFHLKGLSHGKNMEALEEKTRKRIKI